MKQFPNFLNAHRITALLICFLSCCCCAFAQSNQGRPVITPLPDSVVGVEEPVLNLQGNWKFSLNPPDEFWSVSTDITNWSDIKVPGEPFMQGFQIEQDKEFAYRRSVVIPRDFSGRKVYLRFNGVYSHARVWVNGVFQREHIGGFTSWDVDISDIVIPGEPIEIAIGVTDRSGDIARASFYAKHNIGGILRDVYLLALPENHLTRLHTEMQLNDDYTSAGLTVQFTANIKNKSDSKLQFELFDPSGLPVPIRNSIVSINDENPESEFTIEVSPVALWDAEHPRLYTLEARFQINGVVSYLISRKIGFREVLVRNEQLLVNGKPVKLRGINRHSIDPIKGRTESSADALNDVLLFRDANINFVRTSHYPPTTEFLEYCDKYGLYVEVEAPITWWNEIEDSSGFQSEFMNQFEEMIERDRSHPSIVIWSLGNESFWDPNFMLEYEYAKREDPSRPVMWSNAPPADPLTGQYDIFSEHYPDWDAELEQKKMPTLLDEYAHVSSYNYPTLQRDPNIRNFWGKSLKLFWENLLEDDHVLGAAIWGGIDEVFLSPTAPFGYGRWGIVDGWRRPKPEHWLTKKAYSPIRITETSIPIPGIGNPISLPIQNWFDHTGLDEVLVVWSVGSESGVINKLDIAPHTKGVLTIPGRDWENGETLKLKFFQHGTLLVDEYNFPIGVRSISFPPVSGPEPDLLETSTELIVTGSDYILKFSKTTGLITEGSYKGETLIVSGPFLNLAPLTLKPWKLETFSHSKSGYEAVINISGHYGEINISYEIRVDGGGLITTRYTLDKIPEGFSELGLSFELAEAIDRLSWSRNSLWSAYPDDHIGRPIGVAYKSNPLGQSGYRERPIGPWSMDQTDYFIFGPEDSGRATNDFRGSKTDIYFASAILAGVDHRVRVESDGRHAVRMGDTEIDCMIDDKDPALIYEGQWESFEDGANCLGTEEFSNDNNASVQFKFYGDTIRWVGPTHFNMGKADVFVDKQLVATNIDLYSKSKINQKILYSKTDLLPGWHTIKITVSGNKNPASTDSFIVIDGFHYSNSQEKKSETRMNILNEWGYELKWGNYSKNISIEAPYSGMIQFRLSDSDENTSTGQN